MNPEQRLLVIHKYLAVEINVLFLCAFTGVLRPERVSIVDQFRTLCNFELIRIFFLFFLHFFDHMIAVELLTRKNRLCLRCIGSGNVNFHRHEGTILFDHFGCLILVAELQAVLV